MVHQCDFQTVAFDFSTNVAGLSRSLGVRTQPLNIAAPLCGGTKAPEDVQAFDEDLFLFYLFISYRISP